MIAVHKYFDWAFFQLSKLKVNFSVTSSTNGDGDFDADDVFRRVVHQLPMDSDVTLKNIRNELLKTW